MDTSLSWTKFADTLQLQGVLTQASATTLWQAMSDWDKNIQWVNVSALTRVDSAGLALLVYFVTHYGVKLHGMTPNLLTLIQLYNLDKVILSDE